MAAAAAAAACPSALGCPRNSVCTKGHLLFSSLASRADVGGGVPARRRLVGGKLCVRVSSRKILIYTHTAGCTQGRQSPNYNNDNECVLRVLLHTKCVGDTLEWKLPRSQTRPAIQRGQGEGGAMPCVARHHRHDIEYVPLTVLEQTSVYEGVHSKYVGPRDAFMPESNIDPQHAQRCPHSRWAVECTANAEAWGEIVQGCCWAPRLSAGGTAISTTLVVVWVICTPIFSTCGS